ncbi:sigma 54-interacting transcriptional regulator [Dyadobacter sp. CY345]|uniref:sigma-54-dependent Fis family transcriptional regulator n=1 Tax=Dyadobacter sp. CY345 TaxID=2909335 RepID=UPI001F3E8F9E|nr:sigma 54-interacting transcriptional regulator [Dyadobacter sp. CY345]MCF2443485.1 sigma 54-interacting transcriptional regulator [Dyadobacter sp. CY345]
MNNSEGQEADPNFLYQNAGGKKADTEIAFLSSVSHAEIRWRDEENELLLSVNHAIASIRDKRDFVQMIQRELKSYLLFSDIAISIFNLETGTYRVFLEYCEKTILHPDFNEIAFDEYPIADGLHNQILDSNAPVAFYIEEIRDPEMIHIEFLYQAGIKRVVGMRMEQNNQIIGAIVFLSENHSPFSQRQKNFIQRLSYHMTTAVSNIRGNEKIEQQLAEIKKYKELLEEEKLYLQEEVATGYSYHDIVGEGAEMRKVFQLLTQVSFANSTVLLLGETGTGKELIARAIHSASSRKDKLMVKVNCAALPASLIESELFGHERGSFTGATERRLGKFELANKGTLFLDEIGEMPLDLQVRLLRALQEKEIERVGGSTTIRVDVRVIAATNRDLQKEVSEGRFRHDLFYRLNVFPITLPPLRKHKEDIPSLAVHFLHKYARNNGKKISNISNKVMKELLAYNWPGNVRELEHLMERSVLMTTGDTIREMYLPKIGNVQTIIVDGINLKTHEQNERDHIIEVLNSCNGKIYGAGGAAEILNIKVGTLNSKIKKLGIKKGQIVFVASELNNNQTEGDDLFN